MFHRHSKEQYAMRDILEREEVGARDAVTRHTLVRSFNRYKERVFIIITCD